MRCFVSAVGVLGLLLGCSGGEPASGAVRDGGLDASSFDAALPDAGLPDAGLPDAGAPDGSVQDGGVPDGAVDAGRVQGARWYGIDNPRGYSVGAGGQFSFNCPEVLDGAQEEAALGAEIKGIALHWDGYSPALFDCSIEASRQNGFRQWIGVNPIDSFDSRVPAAWAGRSFRDPELVAAFTAFVDQVLAKVEPAGVIGINIGNEVDLYAAVEGWGSQEWGDYVYFYQQIAAHVRAKPGYAEVPIGVKVTMRGILGFARDEIDQLNAHTDIVLVNYFPIDDRGIVKEPAAIAADFDTLMNDRVPPGKQVAFLEIGYPTGAVYHQSSEQKQSAFVSQIFASWEGYGDAIPYMSFVMLEDLAQDLVDFFADYYGTAQPDFLEYLSTLGMRKNDGTEKSALGTFRSTVSAQGFAITAQ